MNATLRKSIWRWRGFDSQGTPPSPLLQLPVELWLNIAEDLDSISAICLKLSCKRLYEAIPMPAQPRSFDQRHALLKRIPPPVRRGHTPSILCWHCQKYHSPEWFVRPVAGYYHILRVWENEHFWILTTAGETACSSPKLEEYKGEKTPITKLCRDCRTFASQRGFYMSCLCGKCVYVLLYRPKDETEWYHCGNYKWVLLSSLPKKVQGRCSQYFFTCSR